MKRAERIYNFVANTSKEQALAVDVGVTTAEIATALAIQRSNCSKDLNELVHAGRLEKIAGRPVRYRLCQGSTHSSKTITKQEHPKGETGQTKPIKTDIFQTIIGGMGSMKVSVEQAKAAILYPPNGLNCLITGPTGSGKTYFAHVMFAFAQAQGLIQQQQKLVVFNCADYAHNTELLMSHLFGYVAGAFTGALEDQEGLIDQADGGMLFLDEVHRLPPEGQEMIFYFMDQGVYSRLGETNKMRKAKVRIMCATTEDPNSSLLNTFVRRIPIHIHLPSFSQRTAKEQVDLVKLLIGLEAKRINRQISISEDAVKALIGSVSFGNIGQLKSNIQLICARSFLNQMDQQQIEITINDLTEEIKIGLSQIADNRQKMRELAPWVTPVLVIDPSESLLSSNEDAYELPYNLYEIIGEKAALLQQDGVNQTAINQFIMTDINVHLKSFYQDHGLTFDLENKLAEIVDADVIELTKKIQALVQSSLGYGNIASFVYAMGLHLSAFLKRSQLGEEQSLKSNESIQQMVLAYPEEHQVAIEISRLILLDYGLALPEEEVDYLTVLLVSLKSSSQKGRIGVVVAAHGNSTATSMVQVTKQLFGSPHIYAVDMPIEMQPKVALTKMIEQVRLADDGSGVLLLVDMGSLATFTEEIYRQTGIEVRTIDMVTTALVLEAARKTELIDTNLDRLATSLKEFRGYGKLDAPEELNLSEKSEAKSKAIVVICSSGQGTAKKMQEIISSYLFNLDIQDIEVLPLSVIDLQTTLPSIMSSYQLLFITGIIDPKVGIPYVSMEVLLGARGEERLAELLRGNSPVSQLERLNIKETQSICLTYLSENFTFINPQKVFPVLWQYSESLCKQLEVVPEELFLINFISHLAGTLERTIKQDSLSVESGILSQAEQTPLFRQVSDSLIALEQTFNLTFSQAERYYIVKIIENTLNKKQKNTEEQKKDTLF